MEEKLCLKCGEGVNSKRVKHSNAVYCSAICRRQHYNKTHVITNAYKNMSSSSIGALHELMVACDLMKKGLQVFRALSPSCDCDLAVLLGKRLVRFEVTSGNLTVKSNKINYPKHKKENFDVIAVISPIGIHYHPENWQTL